MLKSTIILLLCFFFAGFAHQVLYLVFPVLAFIALIENKFRFESNNALRLFFLFFVFVLLLFIVQTILFDEIRMYAAKGVFRYFSYLCLAIYLSYSDPESIKKILENIIKIFSVLTPYGFVEVMLKERYVFVFHHSNNLAYALVLLSFFNLISDFKYKWWYFAALTISIFLTKSSGGTMVLILLTLFHLVFVEKTSAQTKTIVLSTVLVGMAGLIYLFPERIQEQVNDFGLVNLDMIYYRAVHHQFGSYGSGVWRITYWIGIMKEFLDSHYTVLLFGLGLDKMTFGNYAYKFMNIDPHNDYVKVTTEMGLAGLLFLLYFFYRTLKNLNGKYGFILVLIIPMYFGNILVNFPYMMLYIIIMTYLVKEGRLVSSYNNPTLG